MIMGKSDNKNAIPLSEDSSFDGRCLIVYMICIRFTVNELLT